MTPEEHKLVVFMIAQQRQLTQTLIEALKSKGDLLPDDIQAYEALLISEKIPTQQSFAAVAAQYERYAEALGIPVNLKD